LYLFLLLLLVFLLFFTACIYRLGFLLLLLFFFTACVVGKQLNLKIAQIALLSSPHSTAEMRH
jgi:hypothetical protein